MIAIKIKDYYTANLLQQYNKSYIPPTDTNTINVNNESYFIVETDYDIDNDEVTYYVTDNKVTTNYRSQLTVKHLLV